MEYTSWSVFSQWFYVEVINLFYEMFFRSEFRPNMVSVISMLLVYSRLEDEVMARQVHCYIVKVGFNCQATLCNVKVMNNLNAQSLDYVK